MITSVVTDPSDRRDAALNLLAWMATGGYVPVGLTRFPHPDQTARVTRTCVAIINAEFDALDRMMGKEER
jgi:hypothetical protein